jgi:hypothetical protein
VVNAIVIQNAHNIPRNPSNTYKPNAPEEVIVKFVKMANWNLILQHARSAALLKGMAIRTDLPNHLKKKQSELAQRMYKMRRNTHYRN